MRTRRAPRAPVRVNTASASTSSRVEATAARCARYSCSCNGWSPSAHNADTDFGTENVRSNPATAARVFVSCSSAMIFSTIAARVCAVIDSGSAPTRRAIRSCRVGYFTGGRPNGVPSNGLRASSNNARNCSSVTSVPARSAAPRDVRPVPSQVPGG